MNKCCCVRCYSTYAYASGQFAYTYLSSGNKNNVLDSSISLSYDVDSEEVRVQAALDLDYGNIVVKTVNLSKNKCTQNTAIICYPSSSGTCSISFSSINGNEATSARIILFGDISIKSRTYDISYSNIIQNIVSSETVLKSWGYTTIEHSCLLENDCKYLFSTGSQYIEVINCTIDPNFITKTSGSVTTNDWKPSSSNKILLKLGTNFLYFICFNKKILQTKILFHFLIRCLIKHINKMFCEFQIIIWFSCFSSPCFIIKFISLSVNCRFNI